MSEPAPFEQLDFLYTPSRDVAADRGVQLDVRADEVRSNVLPDPIVAERR